MGRPPPLPYPLSYTPFLGMLNRGVNDPSEIFPENFLKLGLWVKC